MNQAGVSEFTRSQTFERLASLLKEKQSFCDPDVSDSSCVRVVSSELPFQVFPDTLEAAAPTYLNCLMSMRDTSEPEFPQEAQKSAR